MQNDVEEIKNRLNIVDVIGDYVRLQRSGTGRWKGLCPFHTERTPSFHVNEERQLWHCFGCGKGGDVFTFVMAQESMDFRDALTLLAERAGVTLSASRSAGRGEDTAVLLEILDLAARFYQKQLESEHAQRTVRPYLQRRGISDVSLATFRIGYAPPTWRSLVTFLASRGYTMEQLAQAGVAIQRRGRTRHTVQDYYDRFRDRIMFPIADPLGRIIGFSGRVLPGADTKMGKYINTPESPVYHKSRVLYGIDVARGAISTDNRAVILEGNMDVIAAHQCGVRTAVAVSGTAFTPHHANIVRRYAEEVILFFDNDDAGRAAAYTSTLTCLAAQLRVRIAQMPEDTDAKDAAELAQQNNGEALRAIIDAAEDAMTVYEARARAHHTVSDLESRKAYVRALAPLIQAHPLRADREYWYEAIAARAHMSVSAVTELVKRSTSTATGTSATPSSPSPSHSSESPTRRIIGRIIALVSLDAAAFAALRECAPSVEPLASLCAAPHYAEAMDRLSPTHRDLCATLAAEHSDALVVDNVQRHAAAEEVKALCARLAMLDAKRRHQALLEALRAADARGDTAERAKILEKINSLMHDAHTGL